MHAIKTALCLIFFLSAITACDQGPANLTPELRPIPSELATELRENVRNLPFNGAHNFRDLGGYQTTDGQRVKWGLIYRSDKLNQLSNDDILYLERLGLKRIIDFRSNEERLAEPDRLSANSKIIIDPMPIAVTGANLEYLTDKIRSGNYSEEQSKQLIVNAYREFVEKYTLLYRAWIHSLLKTDNLPMVFHCNVGKDRTGFAAAILLLALDVPLETVLRDYLATNIYTSHHNQQQLRRIKLYSLLQVDTDALTPLFEVEKLFLEEAFNAIEEHYGSIEIYLQQGLGLDPQKRQQLRDIFTEQG